MAELKLEITEGLDQELKEMAKAQLVSKEDVARGILANCVLRRREQRHTLFGLDLTVVGPALQELGTKLTEAGERAKEKESKPPSN